MGERIVGVRSKHVAENIPLVPSVIAFGLRGYTFRYHHGTWGIHTDLSSLGPRESYTSTLRMPQGPYDEKYRGVYALS